MSTGKTIALTIWIIVVKVMSLLFNRLSRLVIAFLTRSKHLLISWGYWSRLYLCHVYAWFFYQSLREGVKNLCLNCGFIVSSLQFHKPLLHVFWSSFIRYINVWDCYVFSVNWLCNYEMTFISDSLKTTLSDINIVIPTFF